MAKPVPEIMDIPLHVHDPTKVGKGGGAGDFANLTTFRELKIKQETEKAQLSLIKRLCCVSEVFD
jgi:hypothetical protein